MYNPYMEEIHYLLGNTCNLDCDFCFWDMRIPDVSWKTKKHIIDEIKKAGIKKVTVSGGEPTCSRNFLKTLKYMSDNQLSVVLHTNGVSIDDSIAKQISPLVERVSLSLDGSSDEMCIKMRKSANFFSHTIWLIAEFNRLKVPVNIKTLVTKVTATDILRIGEILETKPVSYWSLLEFNPINRGKINESEFLLSDSEFDEVVKKVRKNIKKLNIKVRLFKRNPEKYCFIAANGDVYTSIPNKGDVLVGDLKNTELSKILLLL
jgi:MoaA/NifB/PqqE/SkfB family radical SAM enzyme